MKTLRILLALFSVAAFAAEEPDPNQFDREPGVHVGNIYDASIIGSVVGGGIPAPETRGTPGGYTTLDVTLTPYFVNNTNPETTGAIDSGSPTLTVADATGFAVGNHVQVGMREVHQIVIETPCTVDGTLQITIGGALRYIPILNGDSVSTVADKIRAVDYGRWVLSGTGATIIATQRNLGANDIGLTYGGGFGVTISATETVSGNTAAVGRITNIAGTTITLDTNATATVTGAQVATDCGLGIQAALNASSPGDVVYLPAGTYRMLSTVNIGLNYDNRTIRGAGPSSTIIDARSGYFSGSSHGVDYAWSNQIYASPSTDNTVTAGLTAGSTELTIADTSPFIVGGIIQIAIEDETDDDEIMAGAIPVVGVGSSGFENNTLRRPMARVVSKTSTTLTIFPALHFTPRAGLVAKVNMLNAQINGFGFEDLKFTGQYGGVANGFQLYQAYNCWFKNIEVYKTTAYCIELLQNLHTEMRKCKLHERNNQAELASGAALLVDNVGRSLIEDNIILNVFPPVEFKSTSMCNVVAYNFIHMALGGNLNVNHGPWSEYNLIEGNIVPNIQSDGFFGGSSNDTFFRNWLTGTFVADIGYSLYTSIIGLNRMTREFAFQGNILGAPGWPHGANPYSFGNPNMGNSEFTGSAEPSTGDFWSHWKQTGTLTTRTTDTTGVITVSGGTITAGVDPHYIGWIDETTGAGQFTMMGYPQSGSEITIYGFYNSGAAVFPAQGSTFRVGWGPQGWQELDLDVENTTQLKANYHHWTAGGNEIPAGQSIGSNTLPNSRFRTSKPAFFGDKDWPLFDPFDPPGNFDSTSIATLPAGHRYVHGNEDYLGGVSIPTFNPNPGTFGTTQNVEILCATPDATIYYETGSTPETTSTPTTSSATYSTAISISTTTTIKAFAVKSGLDDSSVQEGTFTITSLPDAPTSLTATTVSSSQINLAWTDNSDNETGFKVYRGTTSGVLSLIHTTAANATSYNNTGLSASTTYYYEVLATNGGGDSDPSNEDSATTSSEGGGEPTYAPGLLRLMRR